MSSVFSALCEKHFCVYSASEQRNMLIKMYAVAVLVVDIVVLIVRCLAAISQALFELFVAPKEKSVQGEVVLVIIPHAHRSVLP